MDRLAKLIDEFNRGLIDTDRLQQELDFQAWDEDKVQGIKQSALHLALKYGHTPLTGKTPEDVLIENETQEEILEMLNAVREIIGDEYYRVLCYYVVDKIKQQEIANRLDISQTKVSYILRNISNKVKENVAKYPSYSSILCRDNLYPKQSTLEASSPTTRGYPFEFLQEVAIGGEWKVNEKTGKKTYVSNKMCMLPEYFLNAFGGDKVTACSLCDICERVIDIEKDSNYL